MPAPVVEARAFRGLEFDARKVPLERVIAPPYDVINDATLTALRKRSPYNVVHVTRPAAKRGAKADAAPAAASAKLEEWIAAGILQEKREEAIYAYEIWHHVRRQEKRMRGVLLAVRVDPTYKTVIPHERIFDKPAEERLRLLRATAVDLEPIEFLYSGRTAEETLWAYVDGGGGPPDVHVTGADGAIHKLWRISDPAVIGTVLEGLKGRKAYIADGHHRYATAIKYAEERRLREYRPPKAAPYDFKMVLLVNMADPGLAILPTHRVVKKPKKIDVAALKARLESDFVVAEHRAHTGRVAEEILAELDRRGPAGRHVLAIYPGKGPEFWVLDAKEPVLPEAAAPGRSFTWRSLDVVFLQKLVLERHVGIPEARWGDDVYYTRDGQEAVDWIGAGKGSLAVFHLPTRLPQLRAIADGGEVMPPKSTYFVPKALSGLVLYRIGKPETAEPTKRRITS